MAVGAHMKYDLIQPAQADVEYYLTNPQAPDATGLDMVDSSDPREWGKSHRDLMLRFALPTIRQNLTRRTLALTVEAYLANAVLPSGRIASFEEIGCNGSSVVPDIAMPFGWRGVKDLPSMPHDYGYELHHRGFADVYGHRWGLLELHAAYREVWGAIGKPGIGRLWHFGLVLFGWLPWSSQHVDRAWRNPKTPI